MKFEPIGTGTALVTPFNQSGEVDYTSLKKLLEFNTENGVEYLVVQGTTGESATCTPKEKNEILEFTKENNPEGLPIVYGIGGNNTADVLSSLDSADLKGVSAVLSVSPYYNKPSQEGIYQHFIAVADRSKAPIIIYNVPGRTASNISAETTLRLSEHENVLGVKEASGDLVQCMEISKGARKGFYLISGDDMLTIPMISIGAKGVISVISNGFPKEFSEMVRFALQGNFQEASNILFRLLPVNPLLYKESNPVGIKQVLSMRNVCDPYVRQPLLTASNELAHALKEGTEQLL